MGDNVRIITKSEINMDFDIINYSLYYDTDYSRYVSSRFMSMFIKLNNYIDDVEIYNKNNMIKITSYSCIVKMIKVLNNIRLCEDEIFSLKQTLINWDSIPDNVPDEIVTKTKQELINQYNFLCDYINNYEELEKALVGEFL